ncbi:MAG TPA: acyl-CoA dehydrogenase family protein, partial [Solirubrobacteraceae bacterium]
MAIVETSADELKALRDLVRDFGRKELRPRFRELEKAGEFPRELYRRMGQLGFFGCIAPDEFGGTNAGYRALAIVAEELAYAYPPISAAMNLQAATVPLTIANWGQPELAEQYVPGLISGELLGYNAMSEPDGGSDFLGAMRTRAVRDGQDYVINGTKMWITNANVADVGIVYCKTDPEQRHKGVSAFVVETSTPGFASQRVKCSALGNLMPTNGLTFDDMRVSKDQLLGEEGKGFTVAMNAMDFGRLTVAARSLGLAQACLDASAEYADQRVAFGKKIGHFQMIKKQLADMVCEVQALRALVYRAAALYDDGVIATRESSIAKYYAGEVCNRAAQ